MEPQLAAEMNYSRKVDGPEYVADDSAQEIPERMCMTEVKKMFQAFEEKISQAGEERDLKINNAILEIKNQLDAVVKKN